MIPDPIRAQAEARPDAAAVVTEGRTWTWADLDACVAACAGRLGGEVRVGVVSRPSADLVVLLFAALRAGAVLVPLAPRWPEAARHDAAVRLDVRLVLDEATLAEIARPRGEGERAAHPVRASQPWTVVHTSGTSGEPKAVLHTIGNHLASARGVNARLGLRAGDTWLLDLPMHHVGGLGVAVRCALAGATMAIPEPRTGTAEALRRFRPTHASLVSTQLFRLLRDDPSAGATLRAILLGGSAIAPGLLDAAVDARLPVCVGYGMTEATSTVTMTAPGADRAALDTSGTALAEREIRIDAAGEIEIRGATLAAGTLTPVGLVPLPRTADGWFRTGDRGALDAVGRLVVAGRIGNGFVSGGENVQPEAVEAALARIPGVAEAVVVPVPSAEWGARPVAFVRPSGLELPAGLREALREALPPHAIPVAFVPWNGPEGMKPDRRGLAEAARTMTRDASDVSPSVSGRAART